MKFSELPIDKSITQGLEEMGIIEMTSIQEQAIPKVLEGKNITGISQTGSGKTAAFLVPIMEFIMKQGGNNNLNALILSPTRELAKQIDLQVQGLGFFTGVSSVAVTGGGSPGEWDVQSKSLKKGCDIVIATPGRLLMHMNLGYVDFSHLKFLVIDEADRLMDMGFQDDLLKIVNELPVERQNLLFSATMPPKVRKFASRVMESSEEVMISPPMPAKNVSQFAYPVEEDQKISLISHIAKNETITSMIVFTGRKKFVDPIVNKLRNAGFKTEGIHSGREQAEREEALRLFSNNKVQVIVATNVISRGIDIENVSHVINFDVPQDSDDYIHRVGRTARADKKGVAITFVSPKDHYIFARIDSDLKGRITKETLPPSIGKPPSLSGFDKDYKPSKFENNRGRNDKKPFFKKKKRFNK